METKFGFKLINSKYIEDIESDVKVYIHNKTRAKLVYCKNNDKNKVFFIAFRTPPENSKGTFHIIEHSVLCGSKKYPVKDPFNELAKGSLYTFLNAMTYSDKTIYPVASCNSKDFFNLMDVYLDAVFNPLIYENPEIFAQEGHSLKLDENTGEPKISGVVYNEMKGATSDPEQILINTVYSNLFPDSIYKYESGGEPEAIPELSYSEFIETHRRFYHPSNSYIYIYGDADIDKAMELLNKDYLSNYEYKVPDTEIEPSSASETQNEITGFYPASPDELENNNYFALSFKVGSSLDPERSIALELLGSMLLDSNASPLRSALIDSGICKEAESYFDSSILDLTLSIIAKKADPKKSSDFKDCIYKCLNELYKKGLDPKLINASINSLEFYMREENFSNRPKGLVYGLLMMNSLLHDGSAFSYLSILDILEKIKASSKNRYFENLIKESLIDNKHNVFVNMSPKSGLQEEIEEKEKQKLHTLLSPFTEEKKNKIIAENKKLEEYQSESDSSEALEKIPLLSISDIDKSPVLVPSFEQDKNSLFIPVSNEIIYVTLLFGLETLPAEFLPYAGLLSDVLGKLDTKKFDYRNLATEIDMYTGGIFGTISEYKGNLDKYSPKLLINGKALYKNSDKLLTLLDSIIFETDFDALKSLKEIIKKLRIRKENYIINNAHIAGALKCMSLFDASSKFREITTGIDYYRFLCYADDEMDKGSPVIAAGLKETARLLFKKENLIIAIGSTDENKTASFKIANSIKEKLSNEAIEPKKWFFDLKKSSQALITPGKVQYNIKGVHYESEYNGNMQVLKTIMSLDYLWNNIRIKLGAYGCGCSIQKSNHLIYMYSYRDPNLKASYECYDKTASYISEFNASEREITKYIIGTINNFDKPLTNSEKVYKAIHRFIANITAEDLQKERDEMLGTTSSKIKKYTEIFNELAANGSIYTVGSESAINKYSGMFENIERL